MHYFTYIFGKELYMFRTDLLPIIRSLYTVFTIKANEMHYFTYIFGKELYMFRIDLLPIVRSLALYTQ